MEEYKVQEEEKPVLTGESTIPDYNITEEDFLIYPYLDESGIVRYVVIVSDYLGGIVKDIGKQKRDQARQGVLLFNELVYQRIGEEKLADFFEIIGSINHILETESETIFNSLSTKLNPKP